MQKKHPVLGIFLVFFSIMVALPPNIFGAEAVTAPPQDRFSEAELDQMLAPIALYPDSLLAQMLMAATYPLEVVEAARWVSQHPDLKDELLDEALLEKDWDISVKSLAHFPEVVIMMDENIEWTTRVGDAFLVQKDGVMDSIQELRARAQAAGNLQSTREQRVIASPDAIAIEPAYPGEMYVPVYDPLWVYGPWLDLAYLPFAIGYTGISIVSGVVDFAFGFSTAVLFGWCDWDWHHHDIYIDYGRVGHFHRFDHNRFYGRARWEHNPGHRRGVAYWDRETSHRFGQHPERSIQSRNAFRGHGDQGFRRQSTESFQRQGVARNTFGSQQKGQGQQFGSQRNFERREFGTRERVRRSPERSVQSRNEFRGYGDQGFRRQSTESFQRQGVARNTFGSQQKGQGQQFGSQRNSERREFGTSERVRRSPERSVQSRNEFRGYGDQGFRRQSTESFQRQGVARNTFGSQQKGQGQQFGSQRNSEQREFGTRERFQQRDRTNSFSRFGNGKREGFTSDRGRFSRESSAISRAGGFRSGSGGSHGDARAFFGGVGRGR